MYRTIVVAYDDSEFSKAALLEASNRVKKYGGSLVLVHAVFFDEEEFGIAPEQREKRLAFGKKICYQTKEKISTEYGIPLESLVCEGDAQDVVVDIAREKKADLIAMGTHGRKGIRRLLMGSVTSGVIVNSPMDVLIVKKPCSECTGTYSSILVAFDGSESGKKALQRACSLSKEDNSAVTVLYVIPRYEEMLGFFKTDSIKKSLSREAAKILDAAAEIASGQGVSVKSVKREGQGADEIAKCASEFENDLIVMGTYGWKGVSKAIMGSTTERVIMNAACPVLAVK